MMVTDVLVLRGLDQLDLPLLRDVQHGPHYDFRMGRGMLLGKDPANSI